ncbi:natural cytotoxicity triggering receptor 3 ligand 1-like [Dermochelys coriacea]|uniref:natural cytotoxicity triggering receptor 3 ligand 1-like n=1 Tax=Dermochelys coriacea TaxID=27794 RepID=UPI001CA84F90|nr:natural cytotoxicity triggering receptor 3 ligand 1-like [Dermochelys coriacea]XP_043373008.1 natural cytotoxicity triggering receptor 3 ligand 1-like [Dermochelys coriacea]XP_043373009.1 natural cytotoxicity triggering receptor 3 ligand 1-like [Dermochelys coriacea]
MAPHGGVRDQTLLVSWYFQDERVAELDGISISIRVGTILFSQQQGHTQAPLLLPGVTLADQGRYRCSVRYAGQHGEGKVQVQVAALPRVEVPSPVVQREEDSVLVCCVRGFYPQHIAVSWLRDGRELNASFISAARRGHRDETFSLVTVYRFTPTEQDLGALLSCRAWHPLLNQSRQADFRIAFRDGGANDGAGDGADLGPPVSEVPVGSGGDLLAEQIGGSHCCLQHHDSPSRSAVCASSTPLGLWASRAPASQQPLPALTAPGSD